MAFVLTGEEMREADFYTIETCGVSALELMERAGCALADAADRLAPTGKILCVCGGGNNGGDGFVCARVLSARGRETDALCIAEKFSDGCAENKARFLDVGGRILTEFSSEDYALVVDCMFGTGFKGGLQGEYEKLARQINRARELGFKVLAADIPSGISGEDGFAPTSAVRADQTLCIGEIKTGVLQNDGIDFAGEILRADIGIRLPKADYAILSDKNSARTALPPRKRNAHKGIYGRAAIVGGCAAYTGAPYLSAAACLRSGAGYTALYLPDGLLSSYRLKLPEALLDGISTGEEIVFEEARFAKLLSCSAIAYGMGAGVSEDVFRGAAYLLKHYAGTLILDADGLNALAKYGKSEHEALFKNKKCAVVLTPHVKEFSRLTGESVEGVLRKGATLAKEFARKYRVTVLLKNAVSVITDGRRTYFNATGNSGQAKGGSGDVLAGVIAGLCACGASGVDGARLGAYLVGRAAELAAEKIGEYSLTASDLISYLGAAFLDLQTE